MPGGRSSCTGCTARSTRWTCGRRSSRSARGMASSSDRRGGAAAGSVRAMRSRSCSPPRGPSGMTWPPTSRRPWRPRPGRARSSTRWPSSTGRRTCAGSMGPNGVPRCGPSASPRWSSCSKRAARNARVGSRGRGHSRLAAQYRWPATDGQTGGSGPVTEPTKLAAHEFILGRVSWAARVIHRFSTWGATAGFVAGTITFLAVLPLLPRIGDQWPAGAIVLALILVAAPLRVMWHGRRIRATYGDPSKLVGVIESVPGSLDYFLAELEKVKLPREGRPLRRVVAAWDSMLALRRAMNAPVVDQVNDLTAPLAPQSLAITTFSLWATLAILVPALPVVVLALLVALFT